MRRCGMTTVMTDDWLHAIIIRYTKHTLIYTHIYGICQMVAAEQMYTWYSKFVVLSSSVYLESLEITLHTP